MIILALLAAASLAKPLKAQDDYPADAMRASAQGVTHVRLLIDTRGKVYNCAIERSAGFASLDEAACEILTRRARFNPARDAKGEKMIFAYRGIFRWTLPGQKPPEDSEIVDIDLKVKSLPRGMEVPLFARLLLDVDAMGKIQACKVTAGTGRPEIDKIACRAAATYVFRPILDPQGRQVATQRPLTISFKLDSPPGN